MNKEEILAMEAGEGLDSLVHEIVMGLCDHNWVIDKRFKEDYHYRCTKCKQKFNSAGHFLLPQRPSYSTNISAAWPIAVKMGLVVFPLNNGDWACCKAGYLYHLEVTQDHYADPNLVICKEAPEAICKAALLAKKTD